MKKFIFLFLLVFNFIKSETIIPPINISINDGRELHLDQILNQNSWLTSSNKVNTQIDITAIISIISKNINNLYSLLLSKQKHVLKKMNSFFDIHKIKLIAGLGISVYLFFLIKVIRIKNYIKTTEKWFNWDGRFPAQENIKKLLEEIQLRYSIKDNLANSSIAFNKFVSDIEEEISILKKYKSFFLWLIRLGLNSIFFAKTNLLTEITEKINIIENLKKNFFLWLAKYKVENRVFYEK